MADTQPPTPAKPKMVWYVGRHPKDTDERYNAAVQAANGFLITVGVAIGLALVGGFVLIKLVT